MNGSFYRYVTSMRLEESGGALFFQMIVGSNKYRRDRIAILYNEGEEFLKIIVGLLKTLRKQ